MELEDIAEYKHSVRLWQVVSPVLILLGTLGNLLTIIVLARRRSRNSSTAMYLCALAIADLFTLYTGLLRQWLKYLVDVDVRHLTELGCKVHVFCVYLFTQCSSWFLVAVTSERFIGVWFPHRIKLGCTQKNSIVVIIIIASCLICLNIHWLYGMGQYSYDAGNVTILVKCDSLFDHYNTFLNFTWPWMDMCVFALFPFTILMTGNVSIIAKVLVSKHKTRTQVAPSQSSKTSKKDDKTSQLTAMLMTLNVFFLVCVTPICIYLIGEPYWIENIMTPHDEAVLELWWAVVNILMYTNHTMNFLLYFLSGSRFRAEVKSLLFGGRGRSVFGGGEFTSMVGKMSTRTIAHTQNTSFNDAYTQNTSVNDAYIQTTSLNDAHTHNTSLNNAFTHTSLNDARAHDTSLNDAYIPNTSLNDSHTLMPLSLAHR